MNIALVLSGGKGLRMGGDTPKQYMEAAGRPVLFYCIDRLASHKEIDGIQIVAEARWQDRIRRLLAETDTGRKFRGFSAPGPNRQMSVYNGLKDIRCYAGESDNVFIHDAARPLLSGRMISECLKAAKSHEGVIPVLPMKDTVYVSKDGRRISSLLDRSRIFAGQAPEVFRLGVYYEANERLMPERILKINGSTEPAVMAGMDIVMIPGDENNFKITTKEDLEIFRRLMEQEGKCKAGTGQKEGKK